MDIDKLKSIVRRQGRSGDIAADPLVTEIRSQGAATFKDIEIPEALELLGKLLLAKTGAIWEWSYVVAAADLAAFQEFLQNNELPLAAAVAKAQNNAANTANEILAQPIVYRGTYVAIETNHPGASFRTYWTYADQSAIEGWQDVIDNANVVDRITQLRQFWAKDRKRSQRLLCPAIAYGADELYGMPMRWLELDATLP